MTEFKYTEIVETRKPTEGALIGVSNELAFIQELLINGDFKGIERRLKENLLPAIEEINNELK